MSKHRKHNHMKEEQENQAMPDTEQNTEQQSAEETSRNTEETIPADNATEEEQTPSPEGQIAELTERCADLADKNLRMMAEFDNFRRRTAKEKLELQKTAGESIFKDMLPLVDDFERAVNAMEKTDDINSVRDGVMLIYQKFLSFLEKNEVKPIDTKDADFDTTYHEAITMFPAPTPEQKGKVIDCTQKGYTLADKVIRYAKVVVGE